MKAQEAKLEVAYSAKKGKEKFGSKVVKDYL